MTDKLPVSNIKIVSDGTVAGTKVLDSNGNPLTLIKSIKWEAESNTELTNCTIEFWNVPVEIHTPFERIYEVGYKQPIYTTTTATYEVPIKDDTEKS